MSLNEVGVWSAHPRGTGRRLGRVGRESYMRITSHNESAAEAEMSILRVIT